MLDLIIVYEYIPTPTGYPPEPNQETAEEILSDSDLNAVRFDIDNLLEEPIWTS